MLGEDPNLSPPWINLPFLLSPFITEGAGFPDTDGDREEKKFSPGAEKGTPISSSCDKETSLSF